MKSRKKAAVQGRIRQLEEDHLLEINEATAYLLERSNAQDGTIIALREELARSEKTEADLRDELMMVTLRLALAEGFIAALQQKEAGIGGCVALPILSAQMAMPATKWWH